MDRHQGKKGRKKKKKSQDPPPQHSNSVYYMEHPSSYPHQVQHNQQYAYNSIALSVPIPVAVYNGQVNYSPSWQMYTPPQQGGYFYPGQLPQPQQLQSQTKLVQLNHNNNHNQSNNDHHIDLSAISSSPPSHLELKRQQIINNDPNTSPIPSPTHDNDTTSPRQSSQDSVPEPPNSKKPTQKSTNKTNKKTKKSRTKEFGVEDQGSLLSLMFKGVQENRDVLVEMAMCKNGSRILQNRIALADPNSEENASNSSKSASEENEVGEGGSSAEASRTSQTQAQSKANSDLEEVNIIYSLLIPHVLTLAIDPFGIYIYIYI